MNQIILSRNAKYLSKRKECRQPNKLVKAKE